MKAEEDHKKLKKVSKDDKDKSDSGSDPDATLNKKTMKKMAGVILTSLEKRTQKRTAPLTRK